MSAPTLTRPESVLIDKDGDRLEVQPSSDGYYVTVEQGGVLATVGPFTRAEFKAMTR